MLIGERAKRANSQATFVSLCLDVLRVLAPQAFSLHKYISCGSAVRSIRRNGSEASLQAVGVEFKYG